MCCIIHRKKDTKEIPTSNLEKIIKVNSDGWGISYMKGKELVVIKSLEMGDAIKQVRELEDANVEFLFHARYTTHGDNTIANCHPYKLVNGVMFHNGKINIHCRDKRMSDTYYFSLRMNKFLKRKRSIDQVVSKFQRIIGPSRLAFMTNDGEVLKFGEWHEENGCSYSKLNWKHVYSQSAWEKYDEYYAGYNSHGSTSQPMFPSMNDVTKNDNLFTEVMDKCRKGKCVYTYEAKALSHKELTILARVFPKAAAEMLKIL